MGKQFITETFVCGNCTYASCPNRSKNGIVHCCLHDKPVSRRAPFCTDFVADWVITNNRDSLVIVDTGHQYVRAD